jgi:putative ABC transport system substrate-binding protein
MLPKLHARRDPERRSNPRRDATGLAPIERANVAAARAAGLTPQAVKVRNPKPDFDDTRVGSTGGAKVRSTAGPQSGWNTEAANL